MLYKIINIKKKLNLNNIKLISNLKLQFKVYKKFIRIN